MEASFKKNLVQPEYLCSLTKEGLWHKNCVKFLRGYERKWGNPEKIQDLTGTWTQDLLISSQILIPTELSGPVVEEYINPVLIGL